MKRQLLRFGLAAFIGAALIAFGTGIAQAAPHHGGGHGGFHHGHPGPHGHFHHGPGLHHPPVVVVRPIQPRPPIFGYGYHYWHHPRPRYRRGYVSPGAEIAAGVLRIVDGASRW